MHKIMRFYNQNRKAIWGFIIFVAFLIIILQLLNYIAKQDNEKKLNSVNNLRANTIQYNDITLESQKSALSGEKISESQQEAIKTIDKFFSYCNEKNLQKAYNLLTEECKEEMYTTEESFQKSYYEQVLNGQKKNISVENWTSNIFKVKITDDYLSSGNYSSKNTIQDYITVETDDNKEYKLNINGYIGRTNPNKETEHKDIKIKAVEKNIYMDYTTYVFEITNNSYRTILLDDLKNIDSMYIQDDNKMKYSSYTHELSLGELQINSGEQRKIKIKYYSKYSSVKRITNIVFSKVILDYESYSSLSNKNSYGNYYTFEIGV